MTREDADFIGAMSMCDEISDEAYKKIMRHCEEQEPCEDAISREAVWTKITNGALPLESPEQFIDRISKEVEAMPSVTPKRKTGKILTDYAIGIDKKGFERKLVNTRYCSLCKCDLGYNADILTHYCPNCGAKMENEE